MVQKTNEELVKKKITDLMTIGAATSLYENIIANGWIPVHEYFRLCQEANKHNLNSFILDRVLVYIIEDNGFCGLPRIAEYRDGDKGLGWYTPEDDYLNDYTNVMFWKPIENMGNKRFIESFIKDIEDRENIKIDKKKFFESLVNISKKESSKYLK